MPWVRLDDATYENSKVMAAGPLAELLWRRSIEYAARNLTDGFIPFRVVPSLVNWDGVAEYDPSREDERQVMGFQIRPYSLATTLMEAGLWDEVDGGFRIHDYLDYQPSRVQVEADRARNAAYQAAHRQRKAESKTAVSHLVSTESDDDKAPVSSLPYPVPYPVPEDVKATEIKPKDLDTAVVVVAPGRRAATTTTAVSPSVVLFQEMSEGAQAVLTRWRECHGKRSPPKLNPTQARKLEEAVADLGTERLCESAEWTATKGLAEFHKTVTAAYTKRQRDDAAEQEPVIARRNGHASRMHREAGTPSPFAKFR